MCCSRKDDDSVEIQAEVTQVSGQMESTKQGAEEMERKKGAEQEEEKERDARSDLFSC